MKTKTLFILLLSILAFGCKNDTAKADISKQGKVKSIPVFAGNIVKDSIRKTISTSGNVRAIAEANIISKTGGEIKEILVEEGSSVEKGQVLLKIDDFYAQKEKEGAEALLIGATARYEYEQQTAEKKVSTHLKDAEANLKIAKANLELLKNGARPEELKRLEAEKNAAEALHKQAKNNYSRKKNLWEEKLISSQEWENTETQLKTSESQYNAISEQHNILVKGARKENIKKAEAQVEKAEAAFELADIQYKGKAWYKDLKSASAHLKDAQAKYDLAEKALEDTAIKAPFKGTVMKKFINLGENASKDSLVFSIADFSNVKIELNVSESNLPDLQKGQSSEIKLDAYKNKIFTGRIINISPGVEEKDRTSKVEILIPNGSNLLRPGMFAQVDIIVEEHNDAFVLPSKSITEKDGQKGVYIINNTTTRFKQITTGLITESKTEIVSGLSLEDKIVIKGVSNIWDGAKVEIVISNQ